MTANEIRKRYNQELRAKLWQDMDKFIEEIAVFVESKEKEEVNEGINERKSSNRSSGSSGIGFEQFVPVGMQS